MTFFGIRALKNKIVCVPYSGIPDVCVGEWHAENGATVVVGQLICTLVGTTPASEHPIFRQMEPAEIGKLSQVEFAEETLDIRSLNAGVLRRIAKENARLEVGAEIFEIKDNRA